MSGKQLLIIIVGAVIGAIACVVVLRLLNFQNPVTIAGGVAGGVAGALSGQFAARKPAR